GEDQRCPPTTAPRGPGARTASRGRDHAGHDHRPDDRRPGPGPPAARDLRALREGRILEQGRQLPQRALPVGRRLRRGDRVEPPAHRALAREAAGGQGHRQASRLHHRPTRPPQRPPTPPPPRPPPPPPGPPPRGLTGCSEKTSSWSTTGPTAAT